MTNINDETKGNFLGLIPLIFFILIFLIFGLYTGNFYSIPVLVVFSLTSVIAFIINSHFSFQVKLDTFCKGAGDKNIVLMILIFLLAGIFAEIAKASGGVQAAVSLGINLVPNSFLIAGLFLIALVISLAMGSSVGTIVSLSPIGAGIASNLNIELAPIAGAIIGGAMFGDNLSFISDTTIAACRTQKCDMKEKFKSNFYIVLPAAILTLFFYLFFNQQNVPTLPSQPSLINFYALIPYVIVLIMALMGINVLIVLFSGILLASSLGIFQGQFSFTELIENIHHGMENMLNLSILSMLSGGLVALIKLYGGIQYLLYKINKKIKSQKGAEFAIALLASFTDICTANNTVTIVMVGPMARKISKKFSLSAKRTASLLDIFAASFQGIIPYGAQLLAASSLLKISPFSIMEYLYYPYLMLLAGIISIVIKKD